MEISKQASSFYAGVIVGVVGNLFVSYMIEMLIAQFENKPFGIFAYWAFGFTVSLVLFFQVVKFIMKRFGTPQIALRVFDIATLVLAIVGIVLIITKSGIIVIELSELGNTIEGNIVIGIVGVLGFVAGFISDFFLKVLSRHYNEHRDRIFDRRVKRGDLRTRIKKLCDTWRMGKYLSKWIDLRKDLVGMVRDIRESLDDEFAELEEEKKTKIDTITEDFLKITAEFSDVDDSTWIEKVKSEEEKICESLEGIAKELT